MIMSGCNIAAEVDAIDEDGDVMESEGEEGVGEEGVGTMEISVIAVPNGAGDVIPVPRDRASGGSIPEYMVVVAGGSIVVCRKSVEHGCGTRGEHGCGTRGNMVVAQAGTCLWHKGEHGCSTRGNMVVAQEETWLWHKGEQGGG